MIRWKRLSTLFLAACLLLLPAFQSAEASSRDDFFNDSVFLGDSLTVGLESFAAAQRKKDRHFLGNAVFLAKASYSLADTQLPDGAQEHPDYEGTPIQPQNALAKIDPKKVFITLGVNDVSGAEKELVRNYKALLRSIKAAAPGAKLYMIAVFPMTPRKESEKRSNTKIDSINTRLLSLAESEGATFIDFNDSLKEDGALKAEYSRDDYVHLSNEGYSVWTRSMYAFAKFMLARSNAAGGTATIVNVKQYVNARKKASASSERVTKIKKGEKVTLLESAGENWYKVSYRGSEMYVCADYLSVSRNRLQGEVCNVSESVNLRKLPSEAAKRIGSAKRGEKLAVSKEYFNPSWYRVNFGGETAYVSSDYLSVGE